MKMLDDMRLGRLRFPGATQTDRMKCQDLFDHFRNFESVSHIDRRKAGRNRMHDDGCLATWMAWAHGKTLTRLHKRDHKRATVTSDAVRNAYAGYKVN